MVSVSGGTSSIAGMTQALPGSIECGGDIGRGRGLACRALAPRSAPSIAQPEDAGVRVGWIVQGVGNLPLLATMPHGAFDLVVVAHRPGEQLARNPGIGKVASVAQRRRELGDGGDPVVDRCAGGVA